MDKELLDRFATRRDQEAFAELLRRHGPMVLSVCRRVLSKREDAEDAFQATFFVLALRASAVKDATLLANWLFGVARRTALKVKTTNTRRRARERRLWEVLRMKTSATEILEELIPILDAEIQRLSPKHRAPIVLCYLEGKSNREAARELGWPEGTIVTRLRDARELLRRRLAWRGYGLSIDALSAGIAAHLSPIALSETLAASTAKLATSLIGGKAAGSTLLSLKSVELAKGMAKIMFLTKANVLIAVALTASLAAVGTVTVAQLKSPPPPPAQAAHPVVPVTQPAQPKQGDDVSSRERKAALAVLIYLQKNRQHFPPNLGAALKYGQARDFLTPSDELRTPIPANATSEWVNQHTSFVYLGSERMNWKSLKDTNAGNELSLVLLYEKLQPGASSPVVVAFMDGHAERLPRAVAQQAISKTLQRLAPLRGSGSPDANTAASLVQTPTSQPSTYEAVRQVSISEKIRAALEANAAELSPISVSWVEQGRSTLTHEQAEAQLDVYDRFFLPHPGRVIVQQAKGYSWSKSLEGNTFETSSDGEILYIRNQIEGRGELSKRFIAKLAKLHPPETWLSAEHFDRVEICFPLSSHNSSGGIAKSATLARLEQGARIVGMEEVMLDGHACTRLTLVDRNPEWGRLNTLPKERNYVFYLDPQMRYAVRRTEERYGDRLLIQTSNSQFEQLKGRNVWLPKKSVTDFYTWPMIIGTYYDAPILSKDLRVSEWSLNAVPDSEFVLNPVVPRTRVSDETAPGGPVVYEAPAVPASR